MIAAVAASVSFGSTTGVGVALGIGVARNFIGWDPTGATVSGTVLDANDVTLATLATGTKVRIIEGALAGDIYEYIGATLTDSDPNELSLQPFDLRVQQYRDGSLWTQVNVGAQATGQILSLKVADAKFLAAFN